MSKALSIQLKAGFLLLIFGLNIIVGFACAVDVDMGFNSRHHHVEEEETTMQAGEKHHHEEESEENEIHEHANGEKHHHEKAAHQKSDNEERDDCCKDKVIKISQTDKAVAQTLKLLAPVFFTAFTATFYNIDFTCTSQVTPSNKYFVRGHHPPIHDIRIAIQSFQI
jgi:hypothetical protein